MIRARARYARRRLNHIEAIHLAASATDFCELIQFATTRKLSRVPDVSRTAAEEIGIEREDHVGLFRTVNRVDVAPKSQLRALARAIAHRRLPPVPLGLRIQRGKRLGVRGERRRLDDAAEDAE